MSYSIIIASEEWKRGRRQASLWRVWAAGTLHLNHPLSRSEPFRASQTFDFINKLINASLLLFYWNIGLEFITIIIGPTLSAFKVLFSLELREQSLLLIAWLWKSLPPKSTKTTVVETSMAINIEDMTYNKFYLILRSHENAWNWSLICWPLYAWYSSVVFTCILHLLGGIPVMGWLLWCDFQRRKDIHFSYKL